MFPDVQVTASMSASADPSAYSKASASSMPVSQSMISFTTARR